jgi:carboxyl-terminal processing protease
MKHFIANILSAAVLSTSFIPMAAASQTNGMVPSRKLQIAEELISHYYVESVDQDTIVDEAIRAMLKTLDPHSAYSTPEETKELNEPLSGNFSGVGISFNMASDTLYVISTISGGPSERVGILPGDRIIEVNDTLIAGVKMKNSDVMRRLRGPKGTRVNVKVLRHNVKELINFTITRADIPIYSVDASYMATPTTGYIRISRFADQTPKEFNEAIKKLKKAGMKNLIIDLQGNGGGYLNAAQEIAATLLNSGDLIVYTDGPNVQSHSYSAPKNGDYRNCRVVVLVDQYSASASEILTGAIQDHDRGVVVGRRTFGKGLVQRPFPFPDGSMIRLTVAKYFTPSGRCIQKPYVKGNLDEYALDLKKRFDSGELMHPDSLKKVMPDSLRFTTLKKHRVVYGGGGIMPDVSVALDTAWYTPYYRDLMAKGLIVRYTIGYIDSHRAEVLSLYPDEDAFADKFIVTDEMMNALTESAASEVPMKEEEYAKSRDYISMVVKALLARDLYDSGSYYRIANLNNPIYNEGVRIINSPKEYDKLLEGE